MRFSALRPIQRFWIGLSLMVLAFTTNSARLRTEVGDGGGKWADAIDSHSEYLVRNAMKEAALGSGKVEWFPLGSTRFASGDFSYVPGSTDRHYTGLSVQSLVGAQVVKTLGLETESAVDRVAGLLRKLNAVLLALALGVFLFRFASESRWTDPLAIMAITACSAGLLLFAQNLYFASALYAFPLAFISLTYGRFGIAWVAAGVFLLVALLFTRGYEFATVSGLLCILPVIALQLETPPRRKLIALAAISAAFTAAFLLVAISHVTLVHQATGQPWAASRALAFSSVGLRTLTTDGVPAPWSFGFLRMMATGLAEPAFVVPPLPYFGVIVPKLLVILAMLAMLWADRKRISATDVQLCAWALATYLSWYVFAYQHIAWHRRYDWFLFAFSVGLAFPLLLHRRISRSRFINEI